MLRTALTLMMATASSVLADQRPFVWTYGSDMMKRGQTEVEHYTTLASSDWSDRENNLKSTHQIELEVGMNQRFDFAIYQVLSQEAGQEARWEGMKLRGRYRLSDSRDWFRPVLYAETKLDALLAEPEYEFKLLLERQFGDFTLALNPICEIEADESEFEFAAGLSYEVGSLLGVGMEVRSSEYGTWIGPTISHGGPGLYTALGAAWSLDDPRDGKPSHEFRLIVGVELQRERLKY